MLESAGFEEVGSEGREDAVSVDWGGSRGVSSGERRGMVLVSLDWEGRMRSVVSMLSLVATWERMRRKEAIEVGMV